MWFFVEEGLSLSDANYGWMWWTPRFTWFGPPECNTPRPQKNESCIAVCCSNVGFTLVILTFVWPSITQDHDKYNVTHDPTGDTGVVRSLRTRVLPGWCSEWWLKRYEGRCVMSSRHVACMRGTTSDCRATRHCSYPSWVGTRSALHYSGLLLVANRSALSCYSPADPLPTCLLSI
jgi:hypothetical protein